MHYYIESGIPVAIGLKIDLQNKHSVICIGHGPIDYKKVAARLNGINSSESGEILWICDVADIVEQYCIMDDNHAPYKMCLCKEVEKKGNGIKKDTLTIGDFEAEYLMVPLYKRMFLEAADAYDICTSILAHHEFGIRIYDKLIGTKDNPVVVRLFMASSRTLRKIRINQFQSDNKELRDAYNEAVFPKFIWVCEVYDMGHYPYKVIGEIIVDATASPEAKADSAIIIHYPHMVCIRKPDALQKEKSFDFEEITHWNPFSPYNGNLSPFDNEKSKEKGT